MDERAERKREKERKGEREKERKGEREKNGVRILGTKAGVQIHNSILAQKRQA